MIIAAAEYAIDVLRQWRTLDRWRSSGTQRRDETNRVKHGLSFSEASVLFDARFDYLVIFDEAHSETEDRFIAIGAIERGIAVVVFTEPDEDTTRIISARWATERERTLYRSSRERRS